jgi:HEAT repeat protein
VATVQTRLSKTSSRRDRRAEQHGDKVVRRLAAEVFGKLGGAACLSAVPALKEAAKDADVTVKGAAEKALKDGVRREERWRH